MILGNVSTKLVPTVKFKILGTENLEEEIESEVDTGFNGGLTLPNDTIARLGFVWKAYESMKLADESKSFVNLYRGIIMWNGEPRLVNVAESESNPLLGTELLLGHRLTIDMRPGGQVLIEPLP